MQRIICLALVLACAWLNGCGADLHLADIDAPPGLAGAALAAAPERAAYAVSDGWMIHGVHVTRDNLAKWAPDVTFHPQEHFLPCDMAQLLPHATLLDAEGRVVRHGLSRADLQNPAGAGPRLVLDPADYNGAPLDFSHDSAGRVTAPMYVSAQVPEDGAFVDIHYIFLMAYNGSQTARFVLFGAGTEVILPHFADHQGDIESISVRVTPDFSRALSVRFEGHGHSTYVSPEDARFAGTHVAVLSALNSHANYNAKLFPKHHQHLQARVSAAGFGLDVVDITDATGPVWQPYARDARGATHDVGMLRFVGLDDAQQPLSDQVWARFEGRIGDTWNNAFSGVRRTDGTKPNFAVRASANAMIGAAIAMGKTKPYTVGQGACGLATRPLIHVTKPAP